MNSVRCQNLLKLRVEYQWSCLYLRQIVCDSCSSIKYLVTLITEMCSLCSKYGTANMRRDESIHSVDSSQSSKNWQTGKLMGNE